MSSKLIMQKGVLEKIKLTYEDYQRLPEDSLYELIEERLVMTTSPKIKHQIISRRLEFYLRKFVTENNIGEVFDAPCDVYLDSENVVQPDLFFISKDRAHIITETNIQGAPDFVVEILSEATFHRDTVKKKNLYSKFRVREYWIVFPEERLVEVHNLTESGQYQLYNTYYENQVLKSLFLSWFELNLESIFR